MNGYLQQAREWVSGLFDFPWWNSQGWRPVSGRKTTSSELVDEESALNFAAVWCATKLICGTGSSLPLPLFRGLSDEQRQKDRKHPVCRLMNGMANPEMTSIAFRSVMWQWQVNWGNAFAEVEREGDDPQGNVKALWPIQPDRVRLKRDPDTEELYYEVRQKPGEAPVDLELWRMFHLPSIITCEGLWGKGVIQHARETIGAGLAAVKYGAANFGDGGMPVVVLETKRRMHPDSREAFRKDWREMHGGPNKDRVAVLPEETTLKPLNLSPEDLQFVSVMQHDIEEIARWYGVPPHMLQHLMRATFNNVEQLGIEFVQYSLIPWLRIWEQGIWHRLLTEEERSEYFAEHNVDALMRGDSNSRSTFYQSALSNAWMTRNEVRKLENLPPVEGGDTFLVQGAMVPLDDDGMPESKFAVTDTADPTMPPADETDTEETSQRAVSALRRVLNRDLSRVLTKESKAMLGYAKKPNEFVDKVDAFYTEHHAFVTETVTETVGALAQFGVTSSPELLVTSWVHDGKLAMLEAAGTTATDLVGAVTRVVESTYWQERPERATSGVIE